MGGPAGEGPAPSVPTAAAAEATPAEHADSAPPQPSPFLAVVQHAYPLRLFPVDGALLVGTTLEVPGDALPIGVLEDGALLFPDRLALPGYWHHVVAIHGKFPEELDMLALGDTGRTGIAESYVLTANGWAQRTSAMGNAYVGLAKVGTGTLALTAPFIVFGHPAFETIRGNTGPKRQMAPRVDACLPEGVDVTDPFYPKARLRHGGMGGTKNGTLIAVGVACDTEKAALEIWMPNQSKSTIVPLSFEYDEFAGWLTLPKVLPGSVDDEAFVVAGGRVIHVKGQTTTALPFPNDNALFGAVDRDGALWVASEDGALFRKSESGFEAVSLPGGMAVDDLAAGSDGELWVSANGALLRQKREGETDAAIALDTSENPVPPIYSVPRPGGPGCYENLVVLYGFTSITPDDYDFPLTRQALKGRTEFSDVVLAVTRDGGRKYLTAQTGTFDLAKRLAKVIEANVQGAKPAIVCKRPEVVREFPYDFVTGELQ